MKDSPGEKSQLALVANNKLSFKNVPLVRKNKIIPINRAQFIQSIANRMKSRLCSDSDSENQQLLKDISALDPLNIKADNLRFGEPEIRRICRRFDIEEIYSKLFNSLEILQKMLKLCPKI